MSNLLGRILMDQFRVDAFVASGGMGSVYRVWDIKRNTPLAMKLLHGDLAEDPALFKRFQREARALQKLAHPNIVPFYGLYQTADFAFLLQQFVDGPSLKDVIKQKKGRPLLLGEALIYLKGLCSALGYAHTNNVVHCDVKPGNVMIDQGGTIYLTDFGIARHTESVTTTMGAAGTPAYMPPEQVLGKQVSPATDVYALSIILFEMLTGQRPFRGSETGTEHSGTTVNERIRYCQLHLQPTDPRSLESSIPESLAQVILKGLEKKAERRFRDASEFFSAVCISLGVATSSIGDRIISNITIEHRDSSSGQVLIEANPDPQKDRGQNKPSHLAFPWLTGGGISVFLVICGAALVILLGGLSLNKTAFYNPTPSAMFISSTPLKIAETFISRPTMILSPILTPKPAYTATPSFLVRPFNKKTDGNAECVSCRVDGLVFPKEKGSYSWNVDFPANKQAILELGWCTLDRPTLDANWSLMDYTLIIDGFVIDHSQLLRVLTQETDNYCYTYQALLEGWSSGRHTFSWKHSIFESLFDGWDVYEKGDYIFKFNVDIE